MARDHVLRTSTSSSGYECDVGSQRSTEESSTASSFSGFSSSHQGGAPSSNSSPLLRKSLVANARGCPTIKVRLIKISNVGGSTRGHCMHRRIIPFPFSGERVVAPRRQRAPELCHGRPQRPRRGGARADRGGHEEGHRPQALQRPQNKVGRQMFCV